MAHSILKQLWCADLYKQISNSDDFDNISRIGEDIRSSIFEFRTDAELTSAEESSTRDKRRSGVSNAVYHSLQYMDKADPHSLVEPQLYGEDLDTGPQPFSIKVHPQVNMLCDIHSHLLNAEIIGLLAGSWDAASGTLFIQAPYPCNSTDRDDDGSTDVELDPVAEIEARESIRTCGLSVVGWYHSHPRFRPHPSITDINNQFNYQNLFHDSSSLISPFVGLIVSTYDSCVHSPHSVHQWFRVTAYKPRHETIEVRLPMHLDILTASRCAALPVYVGEETSQLMQQKLLALPLPEIEEALEAVAPFASSPAPASQESPESSGRRKRKEKVSIAALSAVEAEFDDANLKKRSKKGKKRVENDRIGSMDKAKKSHRDRKTLSNVLSASDGTTETILGEPSTNGCMSEPIEPIAQEQPATVFFACGSSKSISDAPQEEGRRSKRQVVPVKIYCDAEMTALKKKKLAEIKAAKLGLPMSACDDVLLQAAVAKPKTEKIKSTKAKEASHTKKTTKRRNKEIHAAKGVASNEAAVQSRSGRAIKRKDVLDFEELGSSKKRVKPMKEEEAKMYAVAAKSEVNVSKKRKGKKSLPVEKQEKMIPAKASAKKAPKKNKIVRIRHEASARKKSSKLPFLTLLQENTQFAAAARKLLCDASPHLRFLALGAVVLGLHYSIQKRKVELKQQWRGLQKCDKIKASCQRWAQCLGMAQENQGSFLGNISSFLSLAWYSTD